MKEHGLWVEKYRSQFLNDFIGEDSLKKIINNYIKSNSIQNLLFWGPPGTGKTTLAKLIVNNLDCDYLYVNASDERGVDTIRDKVQKFASSATFKPIKVIILDEADYITNLGQATLRNIIEAYSVSSRFILTGNYIERIIDPIQSRCQLVKIIPPSKADIAQHVANILDKEEVKYKETDLALIINKFYPDVRKILNTCQFSVQQDLDSLYLKVDEKELYSSTGCENLILDELKNPKKDSWKIIRQIITDNNITDFEELYKFLYNKVEEYAKDNEGLSIITIEEYLYHSQFRIDKEINFMACISKLLTN